MEFLQKLVIQAVEEKLKDLKVGNTNLSNEEAMDILSVFAHESLSRTQACQFLNVNKSRFFELIAEGKIPKGRKIVGFTELRWYKDELIKAIDNNRTSE